MVAIRDLKHIPGENGLPILGHTPKMLRDAERWTMDGYKEYGPVHRAHFMFEPWVVVVDPDLAKQILLDRQKQFSSEHGWRTTIGKLFHHGLMLRDFEDHRFHRKIMQEAFRSEAMRSYVDVMMPLIQSRLESWQADTTNQMYAHYKQLTLDIASEAFVGLPLGDEASQVNKAFVATIKAAVATIRAEVPGSTFKKGMNGRRFLEEFFGSRIAERRGAGRRDLFSRLCDAQDEDGRSFTDQDIVDHMIFLLMAAHDTTTSTLATMTWELARQPQWQERLRTEVAGRTLTWDDRNEVPEIEWFFKEAMRLHPPVPFVPRRTVTEVELGGYQIPAATPISLSAMAIHRLTEYWQDPETFDPDRFAPDRAEDKAHSHVYFPFSGGAHTCIGMHFAGLMTKAIVMELLNRYRLVPLPGQAVFIQTLPIPKPRGGLPLRLETV
jgi:cytochrome P450